MNKFNKGKLTGIIAASLSAVSLIGVGFASWVIGIQKTETNGNIAITADDVKYKALTLSVNFGTGITLAEASSTEGPFGSDDATTPVMTIYPTFTFTFGKDFDAGDYKFKQIKLEILPAADGLVDNKVYKANGDVVKFDRTTPSLTYFELATTTIDLTATNLDFENIATPENSLTKQKVVNDKPITFNWGSMFAPTTGKASPTAYYNEGIAKKTTETEQKQYMEYAYAELDYMHTKYTGKEMKMKVSLVPTTTTEGK